MRTLRLGLSLVVGLCVLLSTGCLIIGANSGIQGSGQAASEARDVGSFQKIAVAGSLDVDVTFGPTHSVKVETDDNLIDLVQTENESGTLKINVRESCNPRSGMKVHIVMPALEACDFLGSGSVSIAKIEAERFQAKLLGSGHLTADGVVDHLSAKILGSGEADLEGVVAQDADASVLGSGTLRIRAEKTLNIEVLGSGDVIYSGSATPTKTNTLGSGSIRRSDEP